jgi:hypothetical protein
MGTIPFGTEKKIQLTKIRCAKISSQNKFCLFRHLNLNGCGPQTPGSMDNGHYCLWTVMILLRLFQESKNIIFTWGGLQKPLVIFSVPTRENNVFYSPFTAPHSNTTKASGHTQIVKKLGEQMIKTNLFVLGVS